MEGAMVVDIMQRGVRDAYRDGELSVRGLSGRSGASPLEMSSSAHSQQQLHQQQQRHKDSAVDRHAGSDADDDGDEEAQPDDDAAAGAEDACTLAELQTVGRNTCLRCNTFRPSVSWPCGLVLWNVCGMNCALSLLHARVSLCRKYGFTHLRASHESAGSAAEWPRTFVHTPY